MPDPILSYTTASAIASEHGTPVYVYDEARLIEQARATKAFPSPYGLTVRYAMKAAPTRAILTLFENEGLHFDASSGHEVERLSLAGIDPTRISLSTQELPANFADLVRRGITVNACSLSQLEQYGAAFPGKTVGLRFNPGLGSGGNNRTNVGGPASSFGIWHEHLDEAKAVAKKHGLTVFRIHTHIGSGSDPAVWTRAASLSLKIAEAFSTVTHLNLGGGFKVARMDNEAATDLQLIGEPVAELLRDFSERTERQLHLEIEPGTFLVANAGAVLASVADVVDTGAEGYTFIKLDCGMTEVLRPSLYGAQHPIDILHDRENEATRPAIVVGHCCESGDILTPAPGDPEALSPRELPNAQIGDLALIGGAGAYCGAMSAKNYNSFPEAPEVLLREDGSHTLTRKRQSLEQILVNEVDL
ncbi:MAG: diaminopimelate decarboxylase [Puniceicoccaceae bacterium]